MYKSYRANPPPEKDNKSGPGFCSETYKYIYGVYALQREKLKFSMFSSKKVPTKLEALVELVKYILCQVARSDIVLKLKFDKISEKEKKINKIIGTGMAESKGLRHGYVVNKEEVTASNLEAKRQAEAMAHMPLLSCFLAIGGISLDESRATGSAIISRADKEITGLDL
jgi:hypothetical protein